MPTTALTVTATPGLYSQTGQALTMAAGDTANNNHMDVDGTPLFLVAHNSGVSTRTITITSVADDITGRTGDVSAQNIAAGEIRIFHLSNPGWANDDNEIVVSVSHADVELGWFKRQ